MTAFQPELEGNLPATTAHAGGQAVQSLNLFILKAMRANLTMRRLYGFCTKNVAKTARNSFAETTLRISLTL
jgi:hypothetical protein